MQTRSLSRPFFEDAMLTAHLPVAKDRSPQNNSVRSEKDVAVLQRRLRALDATLAMQEETLLPLPVDLSGRNVPVDFDYKRIKFMALLKRCVEIMRLS
jgi:hypothetical protein